MLVLRWNCPYCTTKEFQRRTWVWDQFSVTFACAAPAPDDYQEPPIMYSQLCVKYGAKSGVQPTVVNVIDMVLFF